MVRIIDNYTLYESIGEGNYGKVYRAINKKDKKQYAVKVIEAKKFHQDPKLQEYTVNQINILSNIGQNPHIIGYYDMLQSQNNFYFVYEFCNQGTLQTLLQNKKILKQNEALLILKQLLEGFKILNKYNVIHRDLKPDNIFFKNGVVKLGDFGFCKSLQNSKLTATMLGSPIYMAPQVLKGDAYSIKADIWSIGVVLYQMLYGYCPFQSTSIKKLIQVLQTCDVCFPQTSVVSPATKNLLKKIFIKNPKNRIQWSELFKLNITENGQLLQILQNKPIMYSYKSNNQNTNTSSPSQKTKHFSGHKKQQGGSILKRQQTMANLRRRKNLSIVQNQLPKCNSKKRLSENQITVNKFIKRENTVTGFKNTQQSENMDKITADKYIGFKNFGSKSVNKQFYQNRKTIINQHNDISYAIGLSREVKSLGLKNTNLIIKNILTQALSLLDEFKNKIENKQQFSDIYKLVQIQIEQTEQSLSFIENTKQNTGTQRNWKRMLKQKLANPNNIKPIYQITKFLQKQKPIINLTTEQMKKQLKLLLL